MIQPFGDFGDSSTPVIDSLSTEKCNSLKTKLLRDSMFCVSSTPNIFPDDPLISVSSEVFNTPIDEAAALQLINELYRNDGDAENILVIFFYINRCL
jgi:hypothetical protein